MRSPQQPMPQPRLRRQPIRHPDEFAPRDYASSSEVDDHDTFVAQHVSRLTPSYPTPRVSQYQSGPNINQSQSPPAPRSTAKRTTGYYSSSATQTTARKRHNAITSTMHRTYSTIFDDTFPPQYYTTINLMPTIQPNVYSSSPVHRKATSSSLTG